MMKRLLVRIAVSVFLTCTIGLSSALAQGPILDTAFEQEYHEAYNLGSTAANEVRALAISRTGAIWAATADGVRTYSSGVWSAPKGNSQIGSAYAIALDARGNAWVGAWNGLYSIENGLVRPSQIAGSAISALRIVPARIGKLETLYAAGPDAIWIGSSENGAFTKVKGSWQTNIRAIIPMDDEHIWVGTASGLYLQSVARKGFASTRYSHPNVLLSSNIYGLTGLPGGEVVVASTGGLDFYRGDKRVRSLSAKDGMPYRSLRSVTMDKRGRIWSASPLGIIRLDHGKWSLRHSQRWLQSDDARDVAIAPDGTAWVATALGVDAIRSKQMTLQEKADYFLQQLRLRHIREPGLTGPAVLVTPGDLSRSFIEDDDNDGEHTGMYLAMESMRYAVTKDPTAKENAKAAFHALLVLQQATGTSNFIARSVVPLHGPVPPRHEVDRTFTPLEITELHRTEPRAKAIEKRWVPSPDGKWLWKRDASSDEVDGHMFGYSTYYDLAADDAEKLLVAGQVDRLVGGIVDHGYLLVDIDGKGTQWGNWSPESLNGDPNWHEERAGNAVEMISYLGVAYHMTHKQRYLDSASSLINKHGYDKLMLQTVYDTPSERTHIEDELMSITYPNLMEHLIFPSLSSVAMTSIRRWHRSAARDGIPFYDFVYNHYSGASGPLGRAVETLRDWPLSHIEWTIDNTLREDVTRDLTPGLDYWALNRLLPRSEIGLCMWDQEPYKAVIGNGGQREDRQNDWLLAYWMGRYYGLISGTAN